MTIDMDNYSVDDLKDPKSIGFIDGMEEASEDLECAKVGYLGNLELPSESLANIVRELIEDFVEYAQEYIDDQRDNALVAFLDKQYCQEEDGGN